MADDQHQDNDGVVHYEGGIPVFNNRLDKLENDAREAKDRDDKYKQEQLTLNRRLVWFTALLALVGLIGSAISGYQAHVAKINADAAKDNAAAARGMVEEMKKSGTDTHELAVQAKNQADRMADQLPELRKSARAAQDAAKISRDAMHISERAYITIGNPQFDFVKYTVSLTVTNNGRIPSGPIDVVAHAFVVKSTPPQHTIYLNEAIERGWKRQHFLSVPVGSPFNINHALKRMDQIELNAGHQHIIFVGFADYNDGFPDTPVQRSFFCVDETFNVLMTQSLPFSCDPAVYLPAAEQADGYPNNEDH